MRYSNLILVVMVCFFLGADVKTQPADKTLGTHGSFATCVAASPDGKWAASGGDDANLLVYDLAGGRILHTLSLAPTPTRRFHWCS
ncbi:MAG TPA: hypothetical protein VIL86_00210 [Tepidisphaeraceae bacterium]|jgi:WD40 repeat protein